MGPSRSRGGGGGGHWGLETKRVWGLVTTYSLVLGFIIFSFIKIK
jgi:hypothetical protein